jgi:hypothetical protein
MEPTPQTTPETESYDIEPKEFNEFFKEIPKIFNGLAKILVSYIFSLVFILDALKLLAEKDIPIQTKVVFYAIALILLGISYRINIDKFAQSETTFVLVLLVGNIFGFLFNLIYVLFNLLYENDYLVTFGGLEKFIFSVDSSREGTGLNMFDFVYVSVGILFLYIIVGLIIMYGLSIKDILKKGGGGIKLVVPIVAIFIICFSLFFSIFFFRDFYMNSIYFITGSMLFIYGSNIFNRKSWFLKIN